VWRGRTDVEASRDAEDAMRRSQVYLGVNGHVSRERNLFLAGDELDRRRRPDHRWCALIRSLSTLALLSQ